MGVGAVRLSAVRLSAEVAPSQQELGPDLEKSLAREKAEAAPSVLLLRNDDLGELRRLTSIVLDRGRKHRAKALANVLLGHAKIPLVHGSYSDAGQLLRSTRRLLEHAAQKSDRNLYVVGADDRVFKEVWTRAAAGADADTTPRPAARSLFDLLPKLPVPERVRRRLIGSSNEIRLVHQLIVRAAKHSDPVLIVGDTGTGKEVVARLIHEESARRIMTFVPVNCGAIPRELLESELFGHEPGSHSMAKERKIGLWRVASGGTLFLDEIADLTLDHQVKILRALQEGEIRPVGGIKEVRVDARVVAATNRDVFAMVQAGEFRQDLYYRLRALPIRTPPLREHPEDVPQLAQFFWKQVSRNDRATLSPEMLAELQSYRWPGNARELRAVLSSLFSLFGAEGVGLEHLKAVFQFEGQASAGGAASSASEEIATRRIECVRHLRRADEVLRAFKVTLRPALAAKKRDANVMQSVRQAAEQRLRELDGLLTQPLLFGSKSTFSAVNDLKEQLLDLISLLRADAGRAAVRWRTDLSGALESTLFTLFEEVERLVNEPSAIGTRRRR